MTAAELAALATPAFGAHWQIELSRKLGISFGTICRWAHGVERIPSGRELLIATVCLNTARSNYYETRRRYARALKSYLNPPPPPPRPRFWRHRHKPSGTAPPNSSAPPPRSE